MADLYNELMIRNIDCGVLYMMIKDNEKITRYEAAKREKADMENSTEIDKERLADLQAEIEELSQAIHTFKDKDITLSKENNRYRFSGTIADSLMGRKLRQVAISKGEEDRIQGKGGDDGNDYTDIIINIKFKNDIIIPDATPKKRYDEKLDQIVEVEGKKTKKFISKKKLRQMAYRDGLTINGIRYVNFQRTSSKARTGNCLFIDENYFEEMDAWQNLNIPFSELEDADIVSVRSYQSLIASSIIGTLDIDPYSIVLMDDVKGTATMPCNVVKSVKGTNGKGSELKVAREEYTHSIDLWDGQSLADESLFNDNYYYTRDKDGKPKENSYSNYGFALLRNHFFKSAIFNTKLHKYYEDNNIETITDDFGNEFDSQKVTLITTRNSVKIFKFADIICEKCVADDKKDRLKELELPLQRAVEEQQKNRQRITTAKRNLTMAQNNEDEKPTAELIGILEREIADATENYLENFDRLEDEIKKLSKPVKFERERLTWDWYREQLKGQSFGVCKTEHGSKFGDTQQLWYQVIGSLNFSKDDLWQLAEPQVNEINLMKKHVAFFKHGIDMRVNDSVGNSMMLSLLNINDDISRTKWYVNFRRSYLTTMQKKLLSGKLQIQNSDFCTLVANPYEMLRHSSGEEIESSIISGNECYCTRYADGEELYGMRSPHVSQGNNALLKNTYRPEWEYFNLTDNILIINLWGEGAFLTEVWSGCDTDSDTAYIGNNPLILDKVREVQDFLIPINAVSKVPKKYKWTQESMAKVDGQLCNDYIGKVCNFGRDLQSLYWHLHNTGTEENKKKYLPMIYDDICMLAVLSNIAIDSAKRRFDCNIANEIKKIKNRPYMKSCGAILQDDSVIFVERRYKKSLSEKTIADYEKLVERRETATTDAEIEEINTEIDNLLMKNDEHMVRPDFTKGLKSKPKKKKRYVPDETDEQKEMRRKKQIAYSQEQKELKEKIYRKLESPMDRLNAVVMEHSVRCDRTDFLDSFVSVLKPIPKGIKADYNRIDAVKKLCIEAKQQIDKQQSQYDSGKITIDELYENKQNIGQDVIDTLKDKKITEWDIHKLIRLVYDEKHPVTDHHGKIKKDANGKAITKDNRDRNLIREKAGGYMLQWLYAACPDTFLKCINDSGKGAVSFVREYDPERDESKKIYSLYDKWYVIVKRKPRKVYVVDNRK